MAILKAAQSSLGYVLEQASAQSSVTENSEQLVPGNPS